MSLYVYVFIDLFIINIQETIKVPEFDAST